MFHFSSCSDTKSWSHSSFFSISCLLQNNFASTIKIYSASISSSDKTKIRSCYFFVQNQGLPFSQKFLPVSFPWLDHHYLSVFMFCRSHAHPTPPRRSLLFLTCTRHTSASRPLCLFSDCFFFFFLAHQEHP